MLRYGAATLAGLLVVCGVIAGIAVGSLAGDRIDDATGRAFGSVVSGSGDHVDVSWATPNGTRTDVFEVSGDPPRNGTRVEVAYDPDDPDVAFIPVSEELADRDRAWSALAFAATAAGLALLAAGWQLTSRNRLRHRPGRDVEVRRVQFSTGVSGRSWLETEALPHRWIPVHFDPVLVTLPSPTVVRLHGDPCFDRLVAASVDGRLLYPSGSVRTTEPNGRRLDNPAAPDDDAWRRARSVRTRSRLRNDALLAVPAPLVGLLWAFVDGGGLTSWLAVTAISAAGALFWGAIRGTDPT